MKTDCPFCNIKGVGGGSQKILSFLLILIVQVKKITPVFILAKNINFLQPFPYNDCQQLCPILGGGRGWGQMARWGQTANFTNFKI